MNNMFSRMSKEDLIDFLKDCDVEIESVDPGMGGIYLEGVKLEILEERRRKCYEF